MRSEVRMTKISMAVLSIACLGLISGCGKGEPSNVGPSVQNGPWNQVVTHDVHAVYGYGYVRETDPEGEIYQSDVKPWSGYYYPIKETGLFEGKQGSPAPLQKYDQWVAKAHSDAQSHAADFERNRIYDPGAADWEGLCDAWARAAIMEPEPRFPNGASSVNVDGVKFTVSDLKALLIKSYEQNNGFRTFGSRRSVEDGGGFVGIPADQFHRVLQAELLELKRPVIVDITLNEVWNLPVYKAIVTVKKDPQDPRVMHVKTTLRVVYYSGDPGYQGSIEFWQYPEYTYDLYGIPQADGSIEVHGGAWTGESVKMRPKFITSKPDTAPSRSSRNSEIRTDFVDEIVGKARAGLRLN